MPSMPDNYDNDVICTTVVISPLPSALTQAEEACRFQVCESIMTDIHIDRLDR